MRTLLVVISLLSIFNFYVIYIFHHRSSIGGSGGGDVEELGHHGPRPPSHPIDIDIAEEVPRHEDIISMGTQQYSDIGDDGNESPREQQNGRRNLKRGRNETSDEQTEEQESLVPTLSPTTQFHKQTLYEIQPKPNGWEDNTMGFHDIRHYLRCSHYSHNPGRPLPTEEYWNYLKEAYRTYVDSDLVFDDIVPSTMGYE